MLIALDRSHCGIRVYFGKKGLPYSQGEQRCCLKNICVTSGATRLVFLCFALAFSRNFTFCSAGKSDLLSYFALCLGGIPAFDGLDIFTILFAIVPNLMLLYCFSDFMRQDCAINYVYVFTRLGRKDKWLFQKARQLFAQYCGHFCHSVFDRVYHRESSAVFRQLRI